MGLLDSVIGAMGQGGNQPAPQGDLLAVVTSLLGQGGGLGALMQQFQNGGLGEIFSSWVGTGQNAPVSGSQLGGVLGNDMVAQIARQLGISPDAAMGQLSQVLPQVVDHLTPHGQLPQGGAAGGLGDLGSLAGMLGGLLRR